jgi:hypothetical protein
VQKQTRAGQRTRFKAFIVVGDNNSHVGLGVKCAKEVAMAIRGAIVLTALYASPTLLPSTLRRRRLLPASTRCHASEGRASWKDTGGGERARMEGRPDSLSLLSTLECENCWRCYSSTQPR